MLFTEIDNFIEAYNNSECCLGSFYDAQFSIFCAQGIFLPDESEKTSRNVLHDQRNVRMRHSNVKHRIFSAAQKASKHAID